MPRARLTVAVVQHVRLCEHDNVPITRDRGEGRSAYEDKAALRGGALITLIAGATWRPT